MTQENAYGISPSKGHFSHKANYLLTTDGNRSNKKINCYNVDVAWIIQKFYNHKHWLMV